MAETGYLHDPMPDQTYLAERLKWDSDNRCLVWLTRPLWQFFGNKRSWKSFNAVNAGQPAGHTLSGRNLPVITIDGMLYRQDQIVYILTHNQCPKFMAYKDGNPMNIAPENLYPDPTRMSLFGESPYVTVEYFPIDYLAHMRGDRRRAKVSMRDPETMTPRKADSLRQNLDYIRTNNSAYPPKHYLDDCLDYDPVSGEILWKERPRNHFLTDRSWKRNNTRWAGKPAGVRKPNNAVWVGMEKVAYKADMLAFILMGRELPVWVAHKDGNPGNNAWENLLGVYPEDL